MTTEPVEILRTAMEAIAFRFTLIAQRLDEAFPYEAGDREIVATGGGLLGSPEWTGIMADALDRPTAASAIPEASSRDAALPALETIEGPRVEDFEAPLDKTHEPVPSRHEV